MNSQSENNTWLEKLIQNNGQAMEEIQETPYQPIVYAVPKQIEAQQAASNLGAVIGITAGIIGALTEKENEEQSIQEEEYKEFLAQMDAEYEYEEE